MNKIYRLVWNKSLQLWTVVSENARGVSKNRNVTSHSSTSLTTVTEPPSDSKFYFPLTVLATLISSVIWSSASFAAAGYEAAGGTTYTNCTGTSRGSGNRSNASIAIGENACAQGNDTIAMGGGATTQSRDGTIHAQSIAIGKDAQATGDQSVALGANTRARGDSSVAIGGDDVDRLANNTTVARKYTEITGYTAVAGEYISTSAGHGSTAIGVQADASGDLSTAIGLSSNARGDAASAFGMGSVATGRGSTSFGAAALAEANGAVAMGLNSVSRGINSVAIGANTEREGGAKATGNNSIAIGTKATTSTSEAVAIGQESSVTGTTITQQQGLANRRGTGSNNYPTGVNAYTSRGTAVGQRNVVSNTGGGTAIGNSNTIDGGGFHNIAIGQGNRTTGEGYNAALGVGNEITSGNSSTAIGVNNRAAGNTSIAMGRGTNVLADFGIGQGNTATVEEGATGGIALGNSATTSGIRGIAIGSSTGGAQYDLATAANASGADSIALGTSAKGTGNQAIALGRRAKGTGNNASAYGNEADANGTSSVAVGDKAKAQGDNDIAIGLNAQATGDLNGIDNINSAVAIGANTIANKENTVALGNSAEATGNNATAVGAKAWATGIQSTAVGSLATAIGNYSLAQGSDVEAVGHYSTALGSYSNSNGLASIAIGNLAKSDGDFSIAQGSEAEANGTSSVAVGDKAKAQGDNDIAMGLNAATATGGSNNIAVGNGVTTGATGQNVAMGSGNTTANAASSEGGAVAIGRDQKATGDGAVALGDPNTANGNGTVALGRNNTAAGDTAGNTAANGAVAIGNENQAIGQGSVALGNASTAAAAGAVALGDTANAQTANGVALGSNAVATNADDVALGSGSQTSTATGTGYRTDTAAPSSVVSVGTAGNERRIQNLSDGSADTDAVNVRQLRNVQEGVDQLGQSTADALGGGSSYDPSTGAVSNPTYNINGTDTNNVGDALAELDKGWTLQSNGENSGAVKAGDIVDIGTADGEENLQVAKDGNNIKYSLNRDLKVDSVTAGDTVINNDGMTITGGPSATKDGIDAAGTKVTNVADGTDATDAVNKGQLDQASQDLTEKGFGLRAQDGTTVQKKLGEAVDVVGADPNISTKVENGQVAIELAKDLNVNSVTAGDTVMNTDGVSIANGPSMTKSGIDAAGNKVTNVADGDINPDSKDAINGSQLANNAQSVSDALGGGSTVNPDGTVSNPTYNINGTDTNNVGDALAELNKGWTLQSNGANAGAVKAGDTVDIGTADGEENLQVAKDGNNIKYSLNRNLKVDSVTAGDTVINNDGMTITGGPSVTKDGIDAAGTKVTNVADGTDATDAVNKGQLDQASQDLTNKGFGITAQDGSTVQKKLGEAVDVVGADPNISTKVENGQVAIELSRNLNVNSVIAGDTVMNTDGVSIANGPSMTKSGIDAAGNKVTNVADGDITADSKDAVNGSQLHNTAQSTADALGGGSTVNPDGTVSNPTYNINGTDTNNVGDALAELDKGWTLQSNGANSGAVKAGDTVDIGTADGEENLQVAKDGNNIKYSLNRDLKVDSVTAGDTLINNDGMTITGGPSVTKDGIDAAGTKVTNVADGTDATDAVNKGQLDQASQDLTDKGFGITAQDGTTVQKKLGEAVDVVGADPNISTKVENGQVAIELSRSLDVDSVTAGDTVMNTDGVSIANGPSMTKSGIDAAGNKITNVAAGTDGTDAVNMDQLKTSTAGAKTEVEAGKNMTVDSTTGADGQTIYTVATADDVEFNSVKVGDVNIDGTTGKISGIAAGDVNPDSTDAINGSQLAQNAQSTADALGGGSTVNPDGTVSNPTYNINGTDTNNVGDALAELDKGWTLQSNGANAGAVKAGDTVDIGTADGEENLQVAKEGNNIKYSLNRDLKVDSVAAGDSVLNNDGMTIAGGPSVTKSGIDAAGNKITNVAAGTDGTDAVNKDQLDQVVAGNDNRTNKLGESTASAIGGGSTYDPTTGTISNPTYNINGTDTNNVGDALAELDKGWTLQSNGANAGAVKAGDTVDIGTADGEENLQVAKDGNNIKYSLNRDLNVDSVTAGNTRLDNTGVEVKDPVGNSTSIVAGGTIVQDAQGNSTAQTAAGTTIKNAQGDTTLLNSTGLAFTDANGQPVGPSVSRTGIDAGDLKITNVAPGTVSADSKDAINGSQLHAQGEGVKNIIGGNTQYDPNTGTYTNPDIGGTGQNNINDAIGSISDAATKAKTSVTQGENIVVTESKNSDGSSNYEVATAKDVNFDSVNVGDVNIDGATGKISGVAAGDVNPDSTDAVNGSQLANNAQSVADALGGGSTVNPDGTVSAPNYSVNGTSLNNVGDAITELDKGWNLQSNGANSGAVKAGDTVDIGIADGEENLQVAKEGNNIKYSLNRDLKVDSVTAGDTVINNDGMTITGGPSITKSGIDVAGNKISNVAAGTDGTDAVNKDQLDQATAGAKTEVEAGKNMTVDSTTGADGQTIYTVATADDVEFNSVKVGDVNIDGATGKISGVTDGTVAADSTEAINGSQLHGTAQSVSDALGGGSTVNPDGTVTAPNYNVNGTSLNNVGDAITELDKGWNLQSNGANSGAVKAGDAVDIGTADGEENLQVAKEGNDIKYSLNRDLKVDSVTAGDTVINNDGMTITGGPSITKAGINAGNNKITGVAPGTVSADSIDAINGSQLHAQGEGVKNIIGGNTQYDPNTGTYTNPDIGGTGQNNINDAIGSIGKAAAAAKTEVDAGKNMTVDSTTGADGQTIYTVATADEVEFNSVKVGDVNIEGTTGKISGVAAGDVNPDSTDAVNGSQLANNAQSVADALGGGSTVNPDGTVSAPNYNVNGTSLNNVGDAITELDKGWTLQSNGANSGAVKAGDTVDIGTADDEENLQVAKEGNTIKYSLSRDLNVDSVTAGDTLINTDGMIISGGPSVTKAGINAGNKKITGVAPGTVSADSTEAINGSQLHAQGEGVKNIIGGNTQYDPNTGKYTNPDIGGTGKDNINDAIGAVGDAAKAAKSTVSNEDGNITVNETTKPDGSRDYEVGLVKDIKVDSVTAGGTKVDDNGLTIEGGPSVTKEGIDAGDKKVTGVADGTVAKDSKDAVNGGQLHAQGEGVKDIIGGNTTYDPNTGKYTNTDIGGTGENNINDAIQSVKNDAKAAKTSVSNTDNNLTINKTTKTDGSTDYEVGLADKIKVKQVDADQVNVAGDQGKTSISGGGISITGPKGEQGPSMTTAGINAGGKKVTGVADGAIAKDSQDAVNGSQLHQSYQDVGAALGGGAGYDPAKGWTGPSYEVGGAKHDNVGDALGALDNADKALGDRITNLGDQMQQAFYDTNQRIDDVKKHANAGVAAAMALETAPYISGKYTYAVGAAYHGGENAVGVTLRKTADNGRWSLTTGVAAASQGDPSFRVGLSGVFD
ncbi:ESPR-type extended signal peptide-containing protein [Acinetobacter courvalinii]|uniref:ESPR-type extended signal peptide-containing protein n=1 Tax=Acinetobacter courvalinii TaxID=280147 RepID=UPI003A8502A1